MYYPYFRGKQYELITVRESASLLSQAGFVPIIEPVKESLNGLMRSLEAVSAAGGDAIVVINPYYGDHSSDSEAIVSLLSKELKGEERISVGIALTNQVTVDKASDMCTTHDDRFITLIHAGFTEARELVARLGTRMKDMQHVFLEEYCGKLYRKHFSGVKRILLRDGFQKRTNREHPPVEFFSDLHATYQEEGVSGFGDFLIVGDDYSETGGPAYAVAIHLTFINRDKDDEMHIHHFKSIRQDTPTDPAGKFAEALNELVTEVNRSGTHIMRTEAVNEFLDLHNRHHFPGLGYVKKLSMKHHIETLARYFEKP